MRSTSPDSARPLRNCCDAESVPVYELPHLHAPQNWPCRWPSTGFRLNSPGSVAPLRPTSYPCRMCAFNACAPARPVAIQSSRFKARHEFRFACQPAHPPPTGCSSKAKIKPDKCQATMTQRPVTSAIFAFQLILSTVDYIAAMRLTGQTRAPTKRPDNCQPPGHRRMIGPFSRGRNGSERDCGFAGGHA